nr:MAG TPA: hypothetical protein [Caudoviricetes sp.]
MQCTCISSKNGILFCLEYIFYSRFFAKNCV